jgi:hypothetical protein
MPSQAAYALALVCEAPADRRTASHLADRVLVAEVDWLEEENLDHHRRWQGVDEGSSHLEWHEVPRLARHQHVRPHGHFKGEPGALDAQAARKALLLLATEAHPPDAVILIRDTDGFEERRVGLEQARQERPWPFRVILGVAHPKREAWVIAGFEPRDAREEALLKEVHRELGFDPRLKSETLSAKAPGASKNAKRVLDALVEGEADREAACWTECGLDVLAERGRLSGLAGYLGEVRRELVPLFSGRSRPERVL